MEGDGSRQWHRAKQAHAELEQRLAEVEAARGAYYAAIAELAEAGVSLRRIAGELGLSHQRVHQIVHGQQQRPGRQRRLRRATASAAGAILVALVVTVLAGVPTPWSPQRGSTGQTETARLQPVGLTAHATPREATRAAAVAAYPQLNDPAVELLMTFPQDVALDARVRVTQEAFCRVYSARGIQHHGEVRWTSVGQGIPCRSAQVP